MKHEKQAHKKGPHAAEGASNTKLVGEKWASIS